MYSGKPLHLGLLLALGDPWTPIKNFIQDPRHSKMDIAMAMEIDLGIANVIFHQHFLWRFQKHTTLWDCAESEQHSISDALLLHWTISNQTVLLQLQLQPPLEPRVLHRGPKKYPLGPFSVPFWKEKVTSAKLRYTMLSLKQGWEGGVYKGEIFFSSFLDELEHLEHF